MSESTPQDRYMPPGDQGKTWVPVPVVTTVPGPAAETGRKKEEAHYEEIPNRFRETLETISFVVFLVLMLKAFVAEAYVIPTGSMAITLLGDHINLQCPRCGQKFTANASNNAREIQQDGRGALQTQACCPNCKFTIKNPDHQSVNSGDKVLVLKPVYDLFQPTRHDVVVFKYPGGPQEDFTAKNYIKRLWGLPGEKLAIWGGEVYLVVKGADGTEKLEIIRKATDKIIRMRRLVNDNDKLRTDFDPPWTTSWHPMNEVLDVQQDSPWQRQNDGVVWTTSAKAGTAWLRYQHRFPPMPQGFGGDRSAAVGPYLITDFLAYNSNNTNGFPNDWVGDLMVEAQVDVQASTGKFILELNKGVLNARAIFDLQNGQCTVTLLNQGKEVVTKQTEVKVTSGKHELRFANFDDRLTVWVDGKLPFEEGIPYQGLLNEDAGPRLSDFMPVSLGIDNAKVSVTHLSVWRDLYYSQRPTRPADSFVSEEALIMTPQEYKRLVKADQNGNRPPDVAAHSIKRAVWRPYYINKVVVDRIPGTHPDPAYYPEVNAHHPSDHLNADEYFMLGDNSLQSLDSREWGQVPSRMLLGRAIWVYWPFNSFSSIR